MKSLMTERLTLRPVTVTDITPAYIDALNDPEVVQWTGARHGRWDRARVVDYVTRCNVEGVSLLLGVFLKEPPKHIGNVRLFHFSRVDQHVELALMVFDKSEWSKGYATEAINGVAEYVFHDLGLHRIFADYYAVNTASARLFAKAGFTIEGVFKDHFRVNGRYVDSVRIGKLSDRR